MNKFLSALIANAKALGGTMLFIMYYIIALYILKSYDFSVIPTQVHYVYGVAALAEYLFITVSSYKKMTGEVVWVKE